MRIIGTVLLAALFMPALAQQEPAGAELAEVQVSGNRIQVPFSRLSRDIQLISKEDIQRLAVKSINEVLAYVSGVDVRQRGPFGTQADISIDGGTSEQTLVLLNGVKMSDSQSAHNMMNIPIPLDAVERIEVLRGPAARIYGAGALTGAINIVTKREEHSFIQADLQSGSSFQPKEEGDGSGRYWGGGLQLSGNYGTQRQQHLLALSKSKSNGQRYNSASDLSRLFYNGHFSFNEQHQIQAMLGQAVSRFGANGFYAAPGDRQAQETVNTSLFSLSSNHRWGNFVLSPRISDRYGEDDYRYDRNAGKSGRSKHYNNALMLELNSSLETRSGTLGLGWESRLEKINSSNIGKHQRDNHGIYGEFRPELAGRLSGSLGLYANFNTDFGWQLFPGMDAAWRLTDSWRVSASLGSGERIPSFSDLYLDQRPGNVGTPELQPEKAWSYQGDLQYRTFKTDIRAGYFMRRINGLIDWLRPSDEQPYSPQNSVRNTMQGWYVRLGQHVQLPRGRSLDYRLSYNYLRPRVKVSPGLQSKYALESLRHQLVAALHYQLQPFSFHVSNCWQQRELGRGYLLTDLKADYSFPALRVYLELSNVFNTEYTEAGAVPMPSRWASLGLSYQWTP